MPPLTLHQAARARDRSRSPPQPTEAPEPERAAGRSPGDRPSSVAEGTDAGGTAGVGDEWHAASANTWVAPGTATDRDRIGGQRTGPTRRVEPERSESGSDRERDRRDRGGERRTTVETVLASDTDLPPFDADVDRVVDKLYRELERRMRIERERRGL